MTQRLVGLPAPDFEMDTALGNGKDFGKAKLEDYRGRWLVLFFYPLDFTFVCPTEITALSDAYDHFSALNCDVLEYQLIRNTPIEHGLALSRDANGLGNINYPLGADVTHKVSRDYGVLVEESGVALRGLFIIDPEGELKYQVVNHNDIGRSVDETLRVLQALQAGGLCAANWRPGQKTLDE